LKTRGMGTAIQRDGKTDAKNWRHPAAIRAKKGGFAARWGQALLSASFRAYIPAAGASRLWR
jgi:hypothetical protein